jgi:type I restriction enzyme S subunit
MQKLTSLNLQRISLDECVSEIINGTTESQNDDGIGIPVTRIETIQNARFDLSRVKYIRKPSVDLLEKFRYKNGDIAFSHINSLEHLGKTALYEGNPKDLIHGMNLLRFRPNLEKVIPKYLYFYFQSSEFRETVKAGASHAVNQCSTNQKKLKVIQIPVMEKDTQEKIVKKIEYLLGEIDSGTKELENAKQKLELYRQSVLNSAIRGKLIPEDPKDESASKHLEKIQKEKAKLLAAKKIKNEKALPPITEDQAPFVLPPGWEWVRLGTLLKSINTGKSFRCNERPPTEDEVGVCKVSAVTWGEYDEEASKTCTDKKKINQQYLIKTGDLLFSRANTIELIGAVVIVRKVTKKIMLSDKILRIELIDDELKEWILLFLRSKLGRKQIQELSSGNQMSMRNIGQDAIRSIIIPIPSKKTLLTSCQLIPKIFESLKETDNYISEQLQVSKKLKQSILKKAFEGEL